MIGLLNISAPRRAARAPPLLNGQLRWPLRNNHVVRQSFELSIARKIQRMPGMAGSGLAQPVKRAICQQRQDVRIAVEERAVDAPGHDNTVHALGGAQNPGIVVRPHGIVNDL